MRYRLTAKVSSSGLLAATEIVTDSYLMRLFPSEDGTLAEIQVETTVTDYVAYLSPLTFNATASPSEPKLAIRINTEHKYHDYLMGVLRYYESIGSFVLGIRRLDWDQVRFDWVPEDQAERSTLSECLLGFGGIDRSHASISDVNIDLLTKSVALKTFLDRLVLPLAFYREGMNYYESCRYLNAYVHFFYYLEYMYGRGQYKTKGIQKAFKSEAQLLNLASRIWKLIMEDVDRRHAERLSVYLQERCLESSEEGLLELLVEIRGQLHHANPSGRSLVNPFHEGDWHTVAYVAMSLCLNSFAELFDEAWQDEQSHVRWGVAKSTGDSEDDGVSILIERDEPLR